MRLNRVTLILYGLILAFLSWMVAEPFWAYLVMGLLLGAMAFPLYKKLEELMGRERYAALTTLVIVTLIVVIPISLLTWQIIRDMQALIMNLSVAQVSNQVELLAVWSHNTFGYPATLEAARSEEIVRQVVPEVRQRMAQWIPQVLTGLGTFVVGVFVMMIAAYYALVEGESFVSRLKRASPMDDTLETAFLDEAKQTIEGVLMGQALTALLQGGLGFIAFIVAGIPNPFFWTFVMAVLSFLPVVGAFLVWMPAAIYLFAIGDTFMGVAMVLWGLLVISTVDNVVKPIIIGKRGKLHPLLAFVGVLGGLLAFGFMGFVLGPLVLSLLASVFNVLAETGWEPLDQMGNQDPVETPDGMADPGSDG